MHQQMRGRMVELQVGRLSQQHAFTAHSASRGQVPAAFRSTQQQFPDRQFEHGWKICRSAPSYLYTVSFIAGAADHVLRRVLESNWLCAAAGLPGSQTAEEVSSSSSAAAIGTFQQHCLQQLPQHFSQAGEGIRQMTAS